jgi:GNAT superfamily N-acetyltransferase
MLIRAAEPDDVDVLHEFIVALAKDEDFPGPVTARPQDLAGALFSSPPVVEAVLAIIDGQPAGFALFYPIYSTISGRQGIHLEDLFVRPEHRGSGLGRQILAHLARLATQRKGRLEWWVLRTNEPALRFYARLQARELEEIMVQRLDGDALHLLASHPHP